MKCRTVGPDQSPFPRVSALKSFSRRPTFIRLLFVPLDDLILRFVKRVEGLLVTFHFSGQKGTFFNRNYSTLA